MATETTSDGLADATGIVTHAAETPGMPQLNFDHWGNQIFWLILALIATYFILSRVALPRIGAVLAERQGTITNDIAAAEDLKVKAQEAEAAYDQALIDARAETCNACADMCELTFHGGISLRLEVKTLAKYSAVVGVVSVRGAARP